MNNIEIIDFLQKVFQISKMPKNTEENSKTIEMIEKNGIWQKKE